MSYRVDRVLSLATSKHLNKKSLNFKETLDHGMHGLGFSPYGQGQAPGDVITEEQVRARMKIIAPYTLWVRSFSCTEGNEWIPIVAKEMGLKTLVGAWISDDHEKNEEEIQALIDLANRGFVDIAAVGNEVLYREELEEEELLQLMRRVKQSLPHVPIGYVDAYYEFENRPALVDHSDVILSNCYPFWEGCAFEYSILYMKDMYRRASQAAQGKKVIITETGWPSRGQAFHGAVPSQENAKHYFIECQKWSHEEAIEMFYFTSFDEDWKVGAEGDVGAYWGIWDKNEQFKF